MTETTVVEYHQEHVLKVAKEYFEAIWCGAKPFEIRRNDRGYQTGDNLVLWEFDGTDRLCGGITCRDCKPRWVKARVSYVFAGDPRWPVLERGWVVLGLELVESSDGGR